MSEKRIQGLFEGDEWSYYALLAKVLLSHVQTPKKMNKKGRGNQPKTPTFSLRKK